MKQWIRELAPVTIAIVLGLSFVAWLLSAPAPFPRAKPATLEITSGNWLMWRNDEVQILSLLPCYCCKWGDLRGEWSFDTKTRTLVITEKDSHDNLYHWQVRLDAAGRGTCTGNLKGVKIRLERVKKGTFGDFKLQCPER